MTFGTGVWAVDGNTESANFARLMLQGSTLGAQGCVGHLDCQVTQTVVASSGLIITSGMVVILGAESAFQGSYYAENVGNDTTLTVAATGGSPRSDMVIARAEDPTWVSSPWGNPAAGQIVFPRVLSNVGGGAVTVPGGYSAIPLARIDIPASTSAITNAMIHDLRQVAVPQRQLQVFTATGSGGGTNSTAGTSPVAWPPGATWSMQIPAFATSMQIAWTVSGVLYATGATLGGFVWPIIGSSIGAPIVTTAQSPMYATTSSQALTIAGGDSVSIPASIRGTTQTLQFAQNADGVSTGLASYWKGSGVQVVVEFQQRAAAA